MICGAQVKIMIYDAEILHPIELLLSTLHHLSPARSPFISHQVLSNLANLLIQPLMLGF
jgi:hypothetical protein